MNPLEGSEDPWPAIRFQPILFACIWVGTWHIAYPGGGEASIGRLFQGLWTAWLITGFTCPPLLVLSWWLIAKCAGRWRYRGMWLRLAADIGGFAVMFTYLYARLTSDDPPSDARVFGWILLTGCAFFILLCAGRDAWMLVVTEHRATQIRRDATRDEH